MIKKLLLMIAGAWMLLFAVAGALDAYLNWGRKPSDQDARQPYVSLTAKPALPVVLPTFEMRDQSEAIVSNASLAGRVWVGAFVYAQCDSICPTLNRVMGEIASDPQTASIGFITFSTDPTDDVPKLQRYKKQYPTLDATTWHVIRADTRHLPKIAYALNIIRSPDVMTNGYLPVSENLYLIDKTGTVVAVYNGFDAAQVEALKINAARLVRGETPLPSPVGEPVKAPLPQVIRD